MGKLEDHVDRLFAGYSGRDADDMKAEILANLEARKNDLAAGGMAEDEVEKAAEKSLESIEFLIDGQKSVYAGRLWLELAQRSLIVLLSAWIATMPLLIIRLGQGANGLFLLLSVAAGAVYTVLLLRRGGRDRTAAVNLKHFLRLRRLLWLFWAGFCIACALATSALYFGSDIWFSRRVSIDGPYQLAVLIIHYAVPLLTVVIPVIIGFVPGLIMKYEAGERVES